MKIPLDSEVVSRTVRLRNLRTGEEMQTEVDRRGNFKNPFDVEDGAMYSVVFIEERTAPESA